MLIFSDIHINTTPNCISSTCPVMDHDVSLCHVATRSDITWQHALTRVVTLLTSGNIQFVPQFVTLKIHLLAVCYRSASASGCHLPAPHQHHWQRLHVSQAWI